MLLEVTLVAGPGTASMAPTELSIEWPSTDGPADCSGLAVQRALARRWPDRWFTVNGKELGGLRAGRPPLVNGAVIVAGAVGAPRASARAPHPGSEQGIAAVLSVSSGPGAGAVFALQRGSYTVGRGQCRIQVADPVLSRHHATLQVGSRHITLTPARASSGFAIRQAHGRAEPVQGTVVLEVGHTVVCGDSTLELRLPDAGLAEASLADAGLVDAGLVDDSLMGAGNGPAMLLDPAVLVPLTVPNTQEAGRNKAAMLLTGVLPVLVGGALALLTGSWMFLAFAAMGAVAVVVPLMGGRKRRKAFHAAIARATVHDASRRTQAFPDAGSLLLDCHGSLAPEARAPGTALALRLGTAAQAAALVVSPEDRAFTAPQVHGMPLVVPLGADPLCIRGIAFPLLSLLNYVLMQLDAAHIPVVLLGSPGVIPLAARFLPHTVLAASPSNAAAALTALGQGAPSPPAVLVAVDTPVTGLLAAMPGLRVVRFIVPGTAGPHSVASGLVPAGTGPATTSRASPRGRDTSTATARSVVVRAAGNHVVGTYSSQDFIPDGVPAAVFDTYARRRAWQEARTAGGATVQALGQGHLEPNTLPRPDQCTTDAVVKGWGLAAGGPLRPVPMGQSTAGPVMFDFLRDGPHLLVGGTTGSGKSEILRTLVGSLAAAHSPGDVQFVFIDFKGGAGLGVLGKLPHSTSLITDLGGQGMERTLASLRAEIRHREAALAAVEAADNQAYRGRIREQGGYGDGHGMAHLVVVVDEFRVLVDEFPAALAELMRLAAVGRSLGIHLVMATQRPQGAVNADIRANVSSSICLRVQSPLDSTDVIGATVAATISVSTPGRAYLSRAGAAPQEFQSATLRLPAAASDSLPSVQCAGDKLDQDHAGTDSREHQESDAGAVAGLLAQAWRQARAQRPELRAAPQVIAQELPAEPDMDAVNAGAVVDGVLLGIVDVPQRQSLEPLLWRPRVHTHMAFLGTSLETGKAVGLVVGQLVAARASGPDSWLVYLLDGDGSLRPWAQHRQVGAWLVPEHLRTAAHLVQRLAQTARTSPATFVLCISDWGRWVTALRSSPWHETEDAIADLVRFGGSHVVVVLGGGRELLTAPFLASIPNRVYLSCGSSPEATMLWPRLPRFHPLPGRAAIAGPINEQATEAGQVLAGQSLAGTDGAHIAQLGRAAQVGNPATASTVSCAAATLLVTPLPRYLSLAHMRDVLAGSPIQGAPGSRVVLGLGGDGRQVVEMVLAPGSVVPVLGGPGSGKSSFLQTLALLNGGPHPGPGRVVWLDDAASLPHPRLQEATSSLVTGAVVVAAFTHPGPALSLLPLEWGLRSAQQGIVLMPQRPADADLFGVRLDTAGAEPPGRGVLIDRGRRTWFQFPPPPPLP